MFNEFYHGRLDVARLNYGIITLLPKCQEAYNIPMYRPMCLINVFHKWFTKVVNNRSVILADKLVALVQTTFIKGRFILDGAVLLHETLHEISKRKENAIMFKIDFDLRENKLEFSARSV